jgi:hypothetical protein
MIPLGFTAPLVLGALVLLPVIWWLLRLTPPRPREVAFPPTRILARIAKKDEEPSKSPWWLTALRLALAAAVILALAGPVWRPSESRVTASGPLYLLVDNGWGAAPDWDMRIAAAQRVIGEAETNGRPVALIGTAEGGSQTMEPGAAAAARTRLEALKPRPFPADRSALVTPLRRAFQMAPAGEIVLIADGLAYQDADAFMSFLAEVAATTPLTLMASEGPRPLGLAAAVNGIEALTATVVRATPTDPAAGLLRALDRRGRPVGEATFTFEGTALTTEATFTMPVELRNEFARIEVDGMATAGAVQLLDERWRRRAVGLLSGQTSDLDQPLLSPLHYISRALQPFADIREPRSPDVARGVPELINARVSVIMSADVGTFGTAAEGLLRRWMTDGGVLVRFAGPRLAAAAREDTLLPVRIREGGRTLGGALSWSEPQGLGSYAPSGPFAGLEVAKDVQVTRQVLAEPDGDLSGRTWASLADGTPLVTAERIGQGWLVLVHVTADTTWSNLPLSGSFVEVLRRLVASASLARGAPTTAEGEAQSAVPTVLLPPLSVLDGEGRFTAPTTDAKPLIQGAPDAPTQASREHPPGFYGSDEAFAALNLLKAGDTIVPLSTDALPASVVRAGLTGTTPTDWKPALLAIALVLLILDALAVLFLAGRLTARRAQTAAVIVALALGALVAPSALHAAEQKPTDAFDMPAALQTRMAYVITGDSILDETSRQGLFGLTRIMADRTALEAGEPVGVDIAKDELAFFPILYWAVSESQPTPTPEVMARIDAYMKNGGSIVFDTRDQLTAAPLGGGRVSSANDKLRDILAGLDIPDLEPVPSDHVLTKAFYILDDFPGRYNGGQLWVEALPPAQPNAERPVRAGDGVSPILITSNDLAAAWAMGEDGSFLFPTVPPDERQREMALRVGVNLLMYVLTGNYKADQVHVPALLERLGQ